MMSLAEKGGAFVFVNLVSVLMAFVCFQKSELDLSTVNHSVIIGYIFLFLPVYSLGVISGFAWKSRKAQTFAEQAPQELLHGSNCKDLRGLGNAIYRINHVAFVVADVERSLAFYTEVMGLRQIQRPDFEKHGACVIVGNTELHLIKGQPSVHDCEEIIVPHLALDSERPSEVLENLIGMNVPIRQNLAMPDPQTISIDFKENLATSLTADETLRQFFIRDPDGYYLQICNCDIQTDLCPVTEGTLQAEMTSCGDVCVKEISFSTPTFGLGSYASPVKEGTLPAEMTSCGDVSVKEISLSTRTFGLASYAKIIIIMLRLTKHVRANLRKGYCEMLVQQMQGVKHADEVDKLKFQALVNRNSKHGDITQGFSADQIEQALLKSGNLVPLAILVLKADRCDLHLAIPQSTDFSKISSLSTTRLEESWQPGWINKGGAHLSIRDLDMVVRACKPSKDLAPSCKSSGVVNGASSLSCISCRQRPAVPVEEIVLDWSAKKGGQAIGLDVSGIQFDWHTHRDEDDYWDIGDGDESFGNLLPHHQSCVRSV